MAKKWKSKGAFIERDLGYGKLMKDLRSNGQVDVGVHSDAGETAGTPIAEYAAHHEFGKAGDPETGWMRKAFDGGLSALKAASTKLAGQAIDGKITLQQAADQLGEKNARDQKASIDRAGPGGLIDTRNLRNAIKSEPSK